MQTPDSQTATLEHAVNTVTAVWGRNGPRNTLVFVKQLGCMRFEAGSWKARPLIIIRILLFRFRVLY